MATSRSGSNAAEECGAIDASREANVALTHVVPDSNLCDEEWPIRTDQEPLPPATFVFDDEGRRGTAIDTIVASGCIASGSIVRRSLLFSNVHIDDRCTIEGSVILPGVEVGRRPVVKKAVVDRQCRLPEGLTAGLDHDEDRRRFHVTERAITLIVSETLGQQARHLR